MTEPKPAIDTPQPRCGGQHLHNPPDHTQNSSAQCPQENANVNTLRLSVSALHDQISPMCRWLKENNNEGPWTPDARSSAPVTKT
ncbi:hypothetical protein BDU57DRAFT_513422 [Ampelomyces quisqualis]|uniref:Uncharacterized protein n=1 Tax=Ampelomyces quisqualis TaxID=50730 RepID=A0A6A5QQX5_AMPQU|nr:hypothetical protein BDU57DRAFT_513422 [Ampelomyces quisqualis]